MNDNFGYKRDDELTHGIKKGIGSVYPEGAIGGVGGEYRIEPFLVGKEFKKRFFFGIPLISPLTKEKLNDEDLDDYIKRAMNVFEVESKVDVQPVFRRHRLPFDPNLYHQNIWLEVPNKPVQKVHRLAICSASYQYTPDEHDQYPAGAEIYRIPNQWIDMAYAVRGRLFVNPINPAFSAIGTSTSVAASGATILQFVGQQGWVPGYWVVECTHGICNENGNVPVIINECIGSKAAMLLIDNLLPLYRIANQSMGIDGLSQSVSDLTYQLLMEKRKSLEAEYKNNLKLLKTMTGNNIFASNV